MITNIITAWETATGLSVKPFYTTSKSDCIVYNWYSLADDGAVANKKLELRLITSTYANAESKRKKIIECLVPTGDNIKINGLFECVLNGGGSLYDFDTKTVHTLLYFNCITGSEN